MSFINKNLKYLDFLRLNDDTWKFQRRNHALRGKILIILPVAFNDLLR